MVQNERRTVKGNENHSARSADKFSAGWQAATWSFLFTGKCVTSLGQIDRCRAAELHLVLHVRTKPKTGAHLVDFPFLSYFRHVVNGKTWKGTFTITFHRFYVLSFLQPARSSTVTTKDEKPDARKKKDALKVKRTETKTAIAACLGTCDDKLFYTSRVEERKKENEKSAPTFPCSNRKRYIYNQKPIGRQKR